MNSKGLKEIQHDLVQTLVVTVLVWSKWLILSLGMVGKGCSELTCMGLCVNLWAYGKPFHGPLEATLTHLRYTLQMAALCENCTAKQSRLLQRTDAIQPQGRKHIRWVQCFRRVLGTKMEIGSGSIGKTNSEKVGRASACCFCSQSPF